MKMVSNMSVILTADRVASHSRPRDRERRNCGLHNVSSPNTRNISTIYCSRQQQLDDMSGLQLAYVVNYLRQPPQYAVSQ